MQTAPKHIQLRIDNCLWCGKPLPDGRYDRKTHNECRVRLHRWKKRAVVAQKAAVKQIEKIEIYLNFEYSFCDGVEQLKLIQEAINAVYKKHNIVRVK